jgi:hypothetical protein
VLLGACISGSASSCEQLMMDLVKKKKNVIRCTTTGEKKNEVKCCAGQTNTQTAKNE